MMIYKSGYFYIKRSVLYLFKFIGVFGLFNYLNRNKIKIICLHGIALKDEHKWFPSMFMSKETLKRRLNYIEKNFKVIDLDLAIDLVKNQKIKENHIVITADDGFYNNYKILANELQNRKMPAVFYISTNHVVNQMPIFRHILSYMFFKTTKLKLDYSRLNIPKEYENIHEEKILRDLKSYLIEKYETKEEAVSDHFLEKLGDVLDVDYLTIRDSRMFHLVNMAEIKELDSGLIKIEMHTHRHPNLLSAELADIEIKINKSILSKHLNREMKHFCYPSGVWSKDLWPILKKHQIVSATNGEFGFFDSNTHLYCIPRILDSENVSQIEFEAEITGFLSFLRKLLK